MPAPFALAFAKLVVRPLPSGTTVLDFVERALLTSRPHRPDPHQTTAFLGTQRVTVADKEYLLSAFVAARGESYLTIDEEESKLSSEEYPEPPLKGRVLFIVTHEGHLILQDRAAWHISTDKVLESLHTELRRYGQFEVFSTIKLLHIEEEFETITSFVSELEALKEIEFSRLKHSNPQERSRYFDEAADQRVENIVHRTGHSQGIDRTHPEFQNEVEHARRDYAKISRAIGDGTDGLKKMEAANGRLVITISSETSDPQDVAQRMVATFLKLANKLRGSSGS